MPTLPLLPQAPAPPSPQQIRELVKQSVQQSVQGAIEGQQAAQAALAQTPQAKAVLDALRAEIAGEKANIQALTAQLTPGLSDARQDAVTSQLSNAQDHLQSLQRQLDRSLGGRDNTPFAGRIPFDPNNVIPQKAVDITYAFFTTVAIIAIGVPLVRAFGRFIDRRGQVAATSPTVEPRLERIEQAIEAIAIEVERVSEGQRYTNKVMGELKALPAPNALDQWAGARKEAVPVERGSASK